MMFCNIFETFCTITFNYLIFNPTSIILLRHIDNFLAKKITNLKFESHPCPKCCCSVDKRCRRFFRQSCWFSVLSSSSCPTRRFPTLRCPASCQASASTALTSAAPPSTRKKNVSTFVSQSVGQFFFWGGGGGGC